MNLAEAKKVFLRLTAPDGTEVVTPSAFSQAAGVARGVAHYWLERLVEAGIAAEMGGKPWRRKGGRLSKRFFVLRLSYGAAMSSSEGELHGKGQDAG